MLSRNALLIMQNAEAYNAGESEREMGRVIEELGWVSLHVPITHSISSRITEQPGPSRHHRHYQDLLWHSAQGHW